MAGKRAPQQARNCGREAVGTGRLPQIISAARVSIQAPNKTARITFPEGRTCPAIQDPGERGRRGRQEAEWHAALWSTAFPAEHGRVQRSQVSLSAMHSARSGRKMKKKRNNKSIVSPLPRLFLSICDRILKKNKKKIGVDAVYRTLVCFYYEGNLYHAFHRFLCSREGDHITASPGSLSQHWGTDAPAAYPTRSQAPRNSTSGYSTFISTTNLSYQLAAFLINPEMSGQRVFHG